MIKEWHICSVRFSQSLSRVPMNRSTPGLPVQHQLPEFTQTHVHRVIQPAIWVMPSSHLILCRPLLLQPPIPPSIRVFSNESTLCMRWPKYWSFSFSISTSNEYSGLIPFMIDWLDLCSPRDPQESFPTPQFKSINSLVLCFLYSATLTSIHDCWKNHGFDQMDLLLAKVMSLLFNMLSRLVIAFLPRSKCLLILWLQSPSAVILEPPK